MPSDFFHALDHELFMREALNEARSAFDRGDPPIGAVIVHEGRVVSRGANANTTRASHVAHAELTAVQMSEAYLSDFGPECVLYTTLEPCIMCLATIVFGNIRNVVYGVTDDYTGAKLMIENLPYVTERVHNYVGGILEGECAALLDAERARNEEKGEA